MSRAVLGVLLVALLASTVDARPRRKRRARRGTPVAQRYAQPSDPGATAAVQYGALAPDACAAELAARQIPHVVEPDDGVAQPVRLQGPLHGVTFRASVAEADRATSAYELADCRLVLALDDLAELLSAHDVVEVVHYSMYRRPRGAGKTSEHHAGLAIDVGLLRRADGSILSVLDDFHGRIGATTCGPRARPRRPNPEVRALRAITCAIAEGYLFNVVLTPNFNRGHRNHLHLDLTVGARWFIVR